MKVGHPIKNFKLASYPAGSVTQWFGENVELYAKVNIGLTKGHNGIDIVAPWGTPLYAVEDGLVVEVKNSPDGFGKHLRFFARSGEPWREWTYGHCAEIYVSIGQEVKKGDLIALMGNTGFVVSGATPFWKYNPYAGTHLHLGLRLVEPDLSGWQYNPQTPKISVYSYDNGSLGAIDFAHLLPDDGKTPETITLSLRSAINHAVVLMKRLVGKLSG